MSGKYDYIINELKDNNFLENADIDYKIKFMLKSINIIINETTIELSKWYTVYDKYTVGYYNKAISEMCLNNTKEALVSANNAKTNLMTIDINNENSIKYYMYKYTQEVTQINKLNSITKQLSSQLLDVDKVISDTESQCSNDD